MPISEEDSSEKTEVAPREMEQMLGEMMLFESVRIQNYLPDEFDRDYAPIAAIQHGAPIEFNISGATQLYCDLNNLLLSVRAQVLEGGDHVPGDGDHPGVINNPYHSMWRDQSLTLNGRCDTEVNKMYQWHACISNLLNYTNEVQNTRLH